MSTIFLLLIYAAFISLGLPDSLLGTAWPLMHSDFGVSTDSAGLIYMVTAGSTIFSSMMSSRLIRRFGTGVVTLVSVFLTATALLAISINGAFFGMILLSIPLGLGAGAIDSGLNEFIAEHYSTRQMSWLHCFWGVGATTGPIILASMFAKGISWRQGYQTISVIQFVLTAVLIFSLPFWKKFENTSDADDGEEKDEKKSQSLGLIAACKTKGVSQAMFSFFCYCAAEQGVGLWGATFLIMIRGISAAKAASWISMYYLAITVGRFITGLLASRFSNRTLIRSGQIGMLTGCIIMLLPLPEVFSLIGLIIFGLGCAPVFPCMLQETPKRFDKIYAQDIMGYQMGIAYMGSTFMPPLIGTVCSAISMHLMPVLALFFAAVLLLLSESLNRSLAQKEVSS